MHTWELIAARLLREAAGGMGFFFYDSKISCKSFGHLRRQTFFGSVCIIERGSFDGGAMYYGSSDAG